MTSCTMFLLFYLSVLISQSSTASVLEFIIASEEFISDSSDPIIYDLIKEDTMKRSVVQPS